MSIRFTKIQGAANDFIVINNIEEKIDHEKLPELARRICRRRFSIGADGLIVVEKPQNNGDFRMILYNSDGSEAEMCGNGVRSICCYGYEKGLSGEEQLIETAAGPVRGKRVSPRLYKIRLNDVTRMELDKDVDIDGKTYKVSYVELGSPGVPHGVTEYRGLADADRTSLKELARKLRYSDVFYKGINVNFYEITGESKVNELTYERGVEDFTYACGTGSGSTAAVLTTKKLLDGRNIEINVPGGKLYIDVEMDEEKVKNLYLTGPVKVVCEGTIGDDFTDKVEIW